MTFASETADSRSLDRLVRCDFCRHHGRVVACSATFDASNEPGTLTALHAPVCDRRDVALGHLHACGQSALPLEYRNKPSVRII
jgi:hypothetical protein